MSRTPSRFQPRARAQAGPERGRFDSLVQGVSQQPPHLIAAGQCREQINGWSSPVEGVTKRHPTRLVRQLQASPAVDYFRERFFVQPGEYYDLTVLPYQGNNCLTITLNGEPCYINVHGTGLSTTGNHPTPPATGWVVGLSDSYLDLTENFFRDYVLINNGPFGLLLNRTKITSWSAATSPVAVNEAMLFIEGVTYDVTYEVTLDGVKLAPFRTPKATDTANTISTTLVAVALAAEIAKSTAFTVTQVGSIVYFKRTDGGAFTASIDDSRSNTLARIIKGEIVTPAGLPSNAQNNFVVKVTSTPGLALDDYWLQFTTNGGVAGIGPGVWQETVEPGSQYELDEDTLPLVVYRAAPKVFFVGPADGATITTPDITGTTYTYTFPKWGDRTAGNDKSNPAPKFIGQAITDHVLFRSRYVVSGGQTVSFSEVDDIFNFFQDTTTTTLETGTFDLRASSEQSSLLNWLLPVDESILAFSSNTQFSIRPADADVLTGRTAVMLRLSNIEMNPNIRPKIAGPNVLFATDEFGYTHFREYQFFDTTQRRLGLNLGSNLDICANVPKYIQGLVSHWDVGESLDFVVCRTPEKPKSLYVYKYMWSNPSGGLSKIQASWSEWTFDADVTWVKFSENRLLLGLTYPDGTYLVELRADELEAKPFPQVSLDRRLDFPECNQDAETSTNINATYDAIRDQTTFTLPHVATARTHAVIRYDNNRMQGILLGTIDSGNALVCAEKGDFRSDKVSIGSEYLFKYGFARPLPQERSGDRSRFVMNQNGRYQLSTFTVYFSMAGQFRIRVKRFNRSPDSLHEFRQRFLGVVSNHLTTEPIQFDEGNLRVPVYSRTDQCEIDVETTSWLPLALSQATWEATLSQRSQR